MSTLDLAPTIETYLVPPHREYLKPLKLTGRLAGTVALSLTAMFATDQVSEDIIRRTPSRITHYADGDPPAPQNVATLICPGFNVNNPDDIATALRPVLARRGNIAVAHYADKGLRPRELFKLCNDYCSDRGIDELDIYGHSIGGMVAVELAARRARAGQRTRVINLDCTPESHEHVKGSQQTGVNFLSTTHHLGLHGGRAVRYLIDVSIDISNHTSRPTHAMVKAIQKAIAGQPANRLVQSEARYINSYASTDFTPALQDTFVSRTEPLDPTRDTVIDNPAAAACWQASLPGELYCVRGNTGHADPGQSQSEYLGMMQQIYQAAGIELAA
ncbi:MAG TPA: hypothetical protein VF261_00085 [Candidatus Saccharimonadales bacterium]